MRRTFTYVNTTHTHAHTNTYPGQIVIVVAGGGGRQSVRRTGVTPKQRRQMRSGDGGGGTSSARRADLCNLGRIPPALRALEFIHTRMRARACLVQARYIRCESACCIGAVLTCVRRATIEFVGRGVHCRCRLDSSSAKALLGSGLCWRARAVRQGQGRNGW